MVIVLPWSLAEIPPLLAIALAPPILIWAWGRALEQLGAGVERVAVAALVAHRVVAATREQTRAA